MRFSKKFPTFSSWKRAHPNATTNKASSYEKRVVRNYRTKRSTLASARGHKRKHKLYVRHPRIMYRTTFVLKLPVSHRWKIMRRQIWSLDPINVEAALDKFLNHCGDYIKSRAYATENAAQVGVAANEEISYDREALDIGIEDDDYDDGGT